MGDFLFKCFVDLKKAYDNVDRDLMWKILMLYGIPGNVVQVIKGLYDGAEAEVRVGNDVAEAFETTNGLKQGSVLSPMLFNIFFGVTIAAARERFVERSLGVQVKIRLQGRLLTHAPYGEKTSEKVNFQKVNFPGPTQKNES